jgi:hypothetical protein
MRARYGEDSCVDECDSARRWQAQRGVITLPDEFYQAIESDGAGCSTPCAWTCLLHVPGRGAVGPALWHCCPAHGAADGPGYASSLPRATLSASSTKLRTAGRSSPTRQAAHNDVIGTFLAGTKTRPGRALYSSDDAGHKLMP